MTLLRGEDVATVNKLPVISPFGVLSDSFIDDILKRLSYSFGLYRLFPLEYLDEGSGGALAPVNNEIRINLLLHIAKYAGRATEKKLAERIIENLTSERYGSARPVWNSKTVNPLTLIRTQPFYLSGNLTGRHDEQTKPAQIMRIGNQGAAQDTTIVRQLIAPGENNTDHNAGAGAERSHGLQKNGQAAHTAPNSGRKSIFEIMSRRFSAIEKSVNEQRSMPEMERKKPSQPEQLLQQADGAATRLRSLYYRDPTVRRDAAQPRPAAGQYPISPERRRAQQGEYTPLQPKHDRVLRFPPPAIDDVTTTAPWTPLRPYAGGNSRATEYERITLSRYTLNRRINEKSMQFVQRIQQYGSNTMIQEANGDATIVSGRSALTRLLKFLEKTRYAGTPLTEQNVSTQNLAATVPEFSPETKSTQAYASPGLHSGNHTSGGSAVQARSVSDFGQIRLNYLIQKNLPDTEAKPFAATATAKKKNSADYIPSESGIRSGATNAYVHDGTAKKSSYLTTADGEKLNAQRRNIGAADAAYNASGAPASPAPPGSHSDYNAPGYSEPLQLPKYPFRLIDPDSLIMSGMLRHLQRGTPELRVKPAIVHPGLSSAIGRDLQRLSEGSVRIAGEGDISRFRSSMTAITGYPDSGSEFILPGESVARPALTAADGGGMRNKPYYSTTQPALPPLLIAERYSRPGAGHGSSDTERNSMVMKSLPDLQYGTHLYENAIGGAHSSKKERSVFGNMRNNTTESFVIAASEPQSARDSQGIMGQARDDEVVQGRYNRSLRLFLSTLLKNHQIPLLRKQVQSGLLQPSDSDHPGSGRGLPAKPVITEGVPDSYHSNSFLDRTGSVPDAVVSKPGRVGSVPDAVISKPGRIGSVTDMAFSMPDRVGSATGSINGASEGTGSVQGNVKYVPESYNDSSNRAGSVPNRAGSVPDRAGSVPDMGGAVSVSNNGASEMKKSVPDNPGSEWRGLRSFKELTLAPPGQPAGPAYDAVATGHSTDAMRIAEYKPAQDFGKSMPGWAQNFLRESFARPDTVAIPGDSEASAGAQKASIQRMPQSAGENSMRLLPGAEQTVWTAPGYAAMPLNMTLKQPEEPQQPRGTQITNAEISRMANKVYEILEERISREKRRMGL